IFRLGKGIGDWEKTLQYTITTNNATDISELNTEAIMVYNTPSAESQRLPVAKHKLVLISDQAEDKQIIEELVIRPRFASGSSQLRNDDKKALRKFAEKIEELDHIRIHVTGHSDNVPVNKNGRKSPYKDNYILSEYRAFAVAKFLQKYLYLSAEHTTTDGKGADEPLASNDTKEGRASNRRVHIIVYRTTKSAPIYSAPHKFIGGKQSAMTKGLLPGTKLAETVIKEERPKEIEFNGLWLATQTADIAWIQPAIGEIPSISSTDISIKHGTDHEIELTLNGVAVSYRNFDGTSRGKQKQALSQWKGVELKSGTNLFVAKVLNRSGTLVKTIEHKLRFSDRVQSAKLMREESALVADGLINPMIAIRLTDVENAPIRPGYSVEFTTNAAFKVASDSKFNTENMPGAAGTTQMAIVGENGIVKIKLEPTTNTDNLVITFPNIANNQDAVVETRLKAQVREWIIVGLAEGTSGYNTIRGNTEKLDGNAAREHMYQDGRIAFFAKGQVLGKWLMTMAYDTDKVRPQKEGGDPGLYQAINPGSYYTVYGDSAQNGFDASSSEKLYLKLERDEFSFLYGDFDTSFNHAELAKYSRTLTGMKTRYQDEHFDITVFSSETNQAFVRDELRGKGVTGPYQLTRNKIAINSEKIIIESRNRFRSEDISNRRELQRHTDYDIDYHSGVVQFREPVFSVDQNLDHQYIVAEYESFDSADDKTTYGARAEITVNDKLDIGITHVNEGRTGGEAKLGGIDAKYKLTRNTKIEIETARTLDSKLTAGTTQGNAYQAEIEHQTERTNNKAYLHNTGPGFGMGQTSATETGTRKTGLETSIKASQKINIKGQAYRQKNTTTNDTRDLMEAQAELSHNSTSLRLGLREVQDKPSSGNKQTSQQITSGISQRLMDGKVTLRADREQNLSDDNSVDFPNSTRLGADYKVTDNTSVFIEQEITDGKVRDTRNTLTGLKSSPWDGSNFYTGVTQSSSASGETTSANVSMAQSWKLNDKWSVDIGAEESKTLSVSSGNPFNSSIGFANGSNNDFTATSVGATYTIEKLMWTSRVDARNSSSQDTWGLATSVQTSPQENLSMLASLQLSESNGTATDSSNSTTIGLGLAYRPVMSKWLILDKLELSLNENNTATDNQESWKVINMLNANYKVDRWQLSTQYAAKTIKETIDGVQYHNFVDLVGIEIRYDLTAKWDVGMHANILHSWDLKQYDYNSGVSVGHSFAKNVWVSVGYNFTGFRDEDFSRGNQTSEGAFVRFRIKFDQRSVKEAAEWLKK
ncbi:OmpA family protein, partial [Pseudomonadota bacterium]